MTYSKLLEELKKLTPEQLDTPVVVGSKVVNEFYQIHELTPTYETDITSVVDHPILWVL